MPKLYEEKKNETCYISIKDEDEQIRAVIVDSEGEEFLDGNLFTISRDGTLSLKTGVNPTAAEKAGILLDDEGRIKTNL